VHRDRHERLRQLRAAFVAAEWLFERGAIPDTIEGIVIDPTNDRVEVPTDQWFLLKALMVGAVKGRNGAT